MIVSSYFKLGKSLLHDHNYMIHWSYFWSKNYHICENPVPLSVRYPWSYFHDFFYLQTYKRHAISFSTPLAPLTPTSPSLPPQHLSLPSTDNHAKQEAFVSPLQPSTYTLSIPELAGHKKILKLQLKTAFPIKGTSGCTQIKQIKSRYALTGTGIQYGKPRTPVCYSTGTRYTFYYRGRNNNAVPRPTWTNNIYSTVKSFYTLQLNIFATESEHKKRTQPQFIATLSLLHLHIPWPSAMDTLEMIG